MATAAIWAVFLYQLFGGLGYDPARGYAPQSETLACALIGALPVAIPVLLPLRSRIASVVMLGACCLYLLGSSLLAAGMTYAAVSARQPHYALSVFYALATVALAW